ncbi:hypothetical protein FEM48_Zijuj11G0087800 [Ziziphus jujuba var. spinosa]|uniref:Ubiquitin carboxyl-terminal hydrolase n=1 Tax=Ziziphus jujuba var. spinosa TaxID=714518 RepID=A0A978UHY9_ZIZJJ|nr:hypothetical protein FEM48_Zijuj11G0087800 [Ziziphus jujuba var. spinosa]
METQVTHISASNSVLLQKPIEGSSSFSPPLPVPEETLSGSSPFPLPEPAKGDHALVPLLDSATGSSSVPDKQEVIYGCSSAPCSSDSNCSSPSLPLKTTLVDEPCAPPQSSLGVRSSLTSAQMVSREAEKEDGALPSRAPISSSFDDNYESPSNGIRNEEEEEEGEGREDKPPPSSPVNLVESSSSIQESKPSMVGAGLANLGNTCFINAVLQCFTHTVPLVQGIRSANHAVPCDRGREGFCVICALRDHVDISLASSGGIVSPLKLVNNLNPYSDVQLEILHGAVILDLQKSDFSSYFQRYQQEDAHEFLQCFLDKLERCFLDSKTEKNCSNSGDENLVKRVFGGRLISKLRCCNCGHCSDTYEPLIDLSLEIEDVDTLPSALESFTKLEKIEDSETKFTCENCKEEVAVEKQLMVDQAPTIAAFHLKRFKNDGSYVEKIDKHVEYPMELDLQSYTSCTSQDNVELKYDLYAVVVHVGFSSTSGHYFCFVRSSPDAWYRLDDSKVTRVREEFVLSQDAYILFYAKCGTPWVSSLMEVQKPCLDTNIMNTSPQSVLDNVENTCIQYSTGTSIDIFDDDEFRDAGAGTSSLYTDGAIHEGVDVNNNRDVAGASVCNFEGPKDDRVGLNDSRNELNDSRNERVVDPSVLQGASNSNEASCNSDKKCDPMPLGKTNGHKGNNEEGNDVFHPLTPPRSKSPDTFSVESREHGYQIPRDHLKVENRVACKRPLNKVLEDSQKQEAIRYLTKSVPSSRGSKILALLGSQSQGPLNKKRRFESACKKVSTPNTGHKSSHGSGMRPVATPLR